MSATLDYEELLLHSLHGLVREVLRRVAEEGLPDDHQLYIGFQTGASGVEIPEALAVSHPVEVTVVLEHQFWDLQVFEGGFGVTLAFGGVRHRLQVPFAAVTSFTDPGADFGLQLTPRGLVEPGGAEAEGAGAEGGSRTDTATEDESSVDYGAANVVPFERLRSD